MAVRNVRGLKLRCIVEVVILFHLVFRHSKKRPAMYYWNKSVPTQD